jgi:CHAT domain-containing protein
MFLTTGKSASTRLPALPKVKIEVETIESVATKAGVTCKASSEGGYTKEQIGRELASANVVHIACHGIQHATNPLESAFHISDGTRLSISDLMDFNLKHAHLAFLSACETAKGDRQQPDQAIHLAATMLFVGFRSVVATMW